MFYSKKKRVGVQNLLNTAKRDPCMHHNSRRFHWLQKYRNFFKSLYLLTDNYFSSGWWCCPRTPKCIIWTEAEPIRLKCTVSHTDLCQQLLSSTNTETINTDTPCLTRKYRNRYNHKNKSVGPFDFTKGNQSNWVRPATTSADCTWFGEHQKTYSTSLSNSKTIVKWFVVVSSNDLIGILASETNVDQ